MNILTKRNGIALVAVMAVLLILTLLLPLMFTMSENAMRSAMKGTDELKASYLARTMVEMGVASFQELYDESEDEIAKGIPTTAEEQEAATLGGNTVTTQYTDTMTYKLNTFYASGAPMYFNDLYMYQNADADVSFEKFTPPEREVDPDTGKFVLSDSDYRKIVDAAYATYAQKGIVYTTALPTGYDGAAARAGQIPYGTEAKFTDPTLGSITGKYIGYAKCSMTYNGEPQYFKNVNGVAEPATADDYDAYMDRVTVVDGKIEIPDEEGSVYKVENKNINFVALANIKGKGYTRRCKVVLPTKPSEKNWITPANIESHQIFTDTSLASSITKLDVPASEIGIDPKATQQPVYVFSCVGNMVFSTKNIKYKITEDGDFSGLPKGLVSYEKYVDEYNKKVATHNAKAENASNQKEYLTSKIDDFSLGVHPETTTIKPERDPEFNCIKTNNMSKWYGESQLDNFVAFTATKGIQVDMPVNLVINPCRTGRIGDGIDKNYSLYKILYFQAPEIMFNKEVNSLVSLYTSAFTSGAYRMSSIVLSAPASTPHSYVHDTRKDSSGASATVSAGKVYFMEDAYIWVVPFGERGSNYRTQTVYYKGKDIILYKVANAGDVYYFNNDLKDSDGNKIPFSLTAYFMDVIYEDIDTSGKWYDIRANLKNHIYQKYLGLAGDVDYVAGDLKFIGNMSESSTPPPQIDNFYVVWES